MNQNKNVSHYVKLMRLNSKWLNKKSNIMKLMSKLWEKLLKLREKSKLLSKKKHNLWYDIPNYDLQILNNGKKISVLIKLQVKPS